MKYLIFLVLIFHAQGAVSEFKYKSMAIGLESPRPSLSISPSPIFQYPDSFLRIGSSQSFTISSLGGSEPLTDLSIMLNSPVFSILSSSCGSYLYPNQSCNVTVKFNSDTEGVYSDTLAVYASNSKNGVQSVLVSATAIESPAAIMSLSPLSYEYPASVTSGYQDGLYVQNTFVITNQGTGLPLTNVSYSVSPPFSIYSSSCASSSTILAGQSCNVVVRATSESPGTFESNLIVTAAGGISSVSSLTATFSPKIYAYGWGAVANWSDEAGHAIRGVTDFTYKGYVSIEAEGDYSIGIAANKSSLTFNGSVLEDNKTHWSGGWVLGSTYSVHLTPGSYPISFKSLARGFSDDNVIAVKVINNANGQVVWSSRRLVN